FRQRAPDDAPQLVERRAPLARHLGEERVNGRRVPRHADSIHRDPPHLNNRSPATGHRCMRALSPGKIRSALSASIILRSFLVNVWLRAGAGSPTAGSGSMAPGKGTTVCAFS